MRKSTTRDYTWAHRTAIAARQVDSWLRQIPIDWQPSPEPFTLPSPSAEFLSAAADVRDRAQVENLEWITNCEGPAGRILVFTHCYHLSAAPVRANWTKYLKQEVMGTYLRRRVGARLVTVGNLVGAGAVTCDGVTAVLQSAPDESIDVMAHALGIPIFLLDLRTAPPAVAHWLEEQHTLGHGNDVLKLSVGSAFDILFYVASVTPAMGDFK
jgi:erythromycin esterase